MRGHRQALSSPPSRRTSRPIRKALSVTVSLSFTPAALTVIATRTTNVTLNLSSPAAVRRCDDQHLDRQHQFRHCSVDGPDMRPAQRSVQVPVTGVAVGTTTLRASAPGYRRAHRCDYRQPRTDDFAVGSDDWQSSSAEPFGIAQCARHRRAASK
jgi:hypothetical protein